MAASAISIAPPNSGDAHRARTSSGDRIAYSSATPSRAAASIVPAQRPSWSGFVATARSPAYVNHASTPCSSHHEPISAGERPTVISSSIASASPNVSARSAT